MIETVPDHELSEHPFEELFEFSNDGESSKLSGLASEEPTQPSQMPTDTVNTRQANAAVGLSDQGHANEQLSYAQETIESVQSVLLDSAQPQPSYNWDLDPQDYYDQDDDWRAQPPPGNSEGEFPNSQDGDLQPSDPSDVEFSGLDSLINYSPLNTPSIASISSQSQGQNLLAHLADMPRASTPLQSLNVSAHYSTLATEPDIKPAALVDTWQNEGTTNGMMAWPTYDQDAGRVDPKISWSICLAFSTK